MLLGAFIFSLPVIVLFVEACNAVLNYAVLIFLLLCTVLLRCLARACMTRAQRERVRRLSECNTYEEFVLLKDDEFLESDKAKSAGDDPSREWLRSARELGPFPIMFALSGILGASTVSTHSPELSRDVCDALIELAENDNVSFEDRRAFFDVLRTSHGRTALALSGGGALSLSHLGVCQGLAERGLLPRVVAGASGGSIIAAALAITPDSELATMLASADEWLSQSTLYAELKLGPANGPCPPYFDPLGTMVSRYLNDVLHGKAHPSLMDETAFAASMRAQFGSETFMSAFERSGRVATISVCARRAKGRLGLEEMTALTLSYVTAPNVLLWSAVVASCSLPGLMRSAPLYALSPCGAVVSYAPPGISHIDGSILQDIPLHELSACFHARRVIVSQVNPHIQPLVDDDANNSALKVVSLALDGEVRRRVSFILSLSLTPTCLRNMLGQCYSAPPGAGVTLVPANLQLWRALSQPNAGDIRYMASQGRRAVWAKVEEIETLTSLERTLSTCAKKFADPKTGRVSSSLTPLIERMSRIARTTSWMQHTGAENVSAMPVSLN